MSFRVSPVKSSELDALILLTVSASAEKYEFDLSWHLSECRLDTDLRMLRCYRKEVLAKKFLHLAGSKRKRPARSCKKLLAYGRKNEFLRVHYFQAVL